MKKISWNETAEAINDLRIDRLESFALGHAWREGQIGHPWDAVSSVEVFLRQSEHLGVEREARRIVDHVANLKPATPLEN